MTEPERCPDCGHPNAPGSTFCAACHFPLTGPGAPPTPEDTGAPLGDAGNAAAPPPMLRPIRPRRPRPGPNVALSLWLGVGAFLALLLVLIAIDANRRRETVAVEGSNSAQQEKADDLRATLARDSTDLQARLGLANILFDTGNWSEAIVHYRSVLNHDSTQVSALVDLGVSYYNLSEGREAERLFELALARDPHQPIALFNLGIVYERRGDSGQALRFYHRALESAPPENMKPALMEAMERVSKQSGREAPPLPR